MTNQAAIDKWHEDDNLATYYLFNTCNEQQKQTLLTCATAHSIWTSLTSRFQQNTAERRNSLLQTFLTYTFNPNHCVRAHIEAVKLLAQQLSDAGGNVGDEGKCAGIIASLPPSYGHFLTSWESTPIAERTLNLLTERLVREEARSLRKNGGERSTEDKAFFRPFLTFSPPRPITRFSFNQRGHFITSISTLQWWKLGLTESQYQVYALHPRSISLNRAMSFLSHRGPRGERLSLQEERRNRMRVLQNLWARGERLLQQTSQHWQSSTCQLRHLFSFPGSQRIRRRVSLGRPIPN